MPEEGRGMDAYVADGGFTGFGLEFELDQVDERHFGGYVGRGRGEGNGIWVRSGWRSWGVGLGSWEGDGFRYDGCVCGYKMVMN